MAGCHTSTGTVTQRICRRSVRNLLGLVAVSVVAGLLCPPALAQPDPLAAVRAEEQHRIEVVRKVRPAVVCVMSPSGKGGGSGVLISPDGYAVSNYHVTSSCGDYMMCGLADGRIYDAVIVGIDPTGDVALMKMLGRDDFPFVPIGDSDAVRMGDRVLAMGNPFLLADDFSPTITFGIVSGTHRYQYPANTFLEYTDCIQIDASINPGNSGGPLFSLQAELIGINGRASFEKRGRVNSGAAYAISSNQVGMFISHLMSGRIVDHGTTEFTVIDGSDGRVFVERVAKLSEAARRGLKPDMEILEFGGRPVFSANQFQNLQGIFPEGYRIPLVCRDPDSTYEYSVRLQPVHRYQKAPEIPRERRRREGPDDPDDDSPEGAPGKETVAVPKAVADLLVEREGFSNYWFNQLHRTRVLDGLRKAIGSPDASSGTWTIDLERENDEGVDSSLLKMELVVADAGAGLAGRWYQDGNELTAENEPQELFGILTGMVHMHRLWNQADDGFADIVYHGRSPFVFGDSIQHDVIIAQTLGTTSRWHFPQDGGLPVGVDVSVAPDRDELLLRFEQWTQFGDMQFPARVGVAEPNGRTVAWMRVSSVNGEGVSPASNGDQSGSCTER